MKLIPLANNQTEVELSNGARVFFSYQTPVAAELADGTVIVTEVKYSVTTSKHINQWLAGRNHIKVKQSVIDGMTA